MELVDWYAFELNIIIVNQMKILVVSEYLCLVELVLFGSVFLVAQKYSFLNQSSNFSSLQHHLKMTQ